MAFDTPNCGCDGCCSSRARLAGLSALSVGWDGYDAKPPTGDALKSAAKVIDETSKYGAPAPCIYPTLSQGVQLEWETPELEIEVDCRADGSTEFALWMKGRPDESASHVNAAFRGAF